MTKHDCNTTDNLVMLSIPVKANASVTPEQVIETVQRIINAGLSDAQTTIDDGEGDLETAELAIDLNIGAPSVFKTPRSLEVKDLEWLPIETAPKDRNILGYDPCLKRPFVMFWNVPGRKFLVNGGFGDETPTHWMPLPTYPSGIVSTAVKTPRVLVVVSGGVADTVHDKGVLVEIFDRDNYNEDPEGTGGVSDEFADLASPLCIPVSDSTAVSDDAGQAGRNTDLVTSIGLLEEAESFIAGFEDDPDQTGVTELLERLRTQIRQLRS